MEPKPQTRSSLAAIIFILFYLTFFAIPGSVFFSVRDGFSFLSGVDFKTAGVLIFPLLGLYAFFFIWAQIMIGANMDLLRRKLPNIIKFHRIQGVFTLLFALGHPLLLMIGVGAANFFTLSFVSPESVIFAWFGIAALFIMILTVGTALLSKIPFISRHWRKIHYLNYLLFIAVWIHSWFLGSDVQATVLKYLWLFYAVSVGAAVFGRIYRAKIYRAPVESGVQFAPAMDNSFRVAAASALIEGKPLCVMAGEKKLALIKLKEKFYALDSECTHKGGPLCEGEVSDGVITCPWHGAKFSIETGAVLGPPAETGIKAYQVELRGQDVYVHLPVTQHAAAPVPAKFKLQQALNASHPFNYEPFLTEVVNGMKFEWKLYGILPFTVIAQSSDEIDLYLGEVHATEMDLKKISALMESVNRKWKTAITYCLYFTSKFPEKMLLNIRGPGAPMNIESDIAF